MSQTEGYIKFRAHWNDKAFPMDKALITEINTVRSKLMTKNWMGVLPDGIGFGNISVRFRNSNQFIITGSATGGLAHLQAEIFALIEKYDIPGNQLWCIGQTIASSESLTHAAIYQSNQEIQAVLHIHSKNLWKKYMNKLPTSSQKAAYGTPEIANSIISLFKNRKQNSGVFIMGGHEEGLIAFGNNLYQVFELLNQL